MAIGKNGSKPEFEGRLPSQVLSGRNGSGEEFLGTVMKI